MSLRKRFFIIDGHHQEEWRPVVGWEEIYSVSSLGRVRTEERVIIKRDGRQQTIKQCIRKPGRVGDHYHMVLSDQSNGRTEQRQLHHLVLEAFDRPRPEGLEGCHNNGNGLDCRASNLRWDTSKSNHADKRKHGTHLFGETTPAAKLNNQQVRLIRRLRHHGSTYRELANWFGVGYGAIANIIRGKNWKCV